MVDEQAGGLPVAGPPVVVLSIAADGIDALRLLFNNVPDKSGLAFVVLAMEPPAGRATLRKTVGRLTSMPVRAAGKRQTIEPDSVYVVPFGQRLDVTDNTLTRRASKNGDASQYVDHFLKSLARSKRSQAVCVLLADINGVGARGLVDIRQFGGIVLANDGALDHAAEAPESLNSYGLVDRTLPAEKTVQAIVDYFAPGAPGAQTGHGLLDDQFIEQVLVRLHTATGCSFSGYKKGTISRRISRRMNLHRVTEKDEYLRMLAGSSEEAGQLQKDLLISVTQFFRDPEALNFLASDIIPGLCERAIPGKPIRIWVPGTATGEEAYSLAILVTEALRRSRRQSDVRVFATDIDTDALARARAGIYPQGIETDVPPTLLAEYFALDGGVYRVIPAIRDMITFAEQNVISDPPYSRMDLIVCRNLLIYLEPPLQHRVAGQFYFSLNIHGALVLGSSETLSREMTEWFAPVNEKFRVYRRISGASRPPSRIPIVAPTRIDSALSPGKREQPSSISTVIFRSIVDSLTVCSVVVNRELTIQHASGDTSPFLTLPGGQPDNQLMSMVKPGIRRAVRSLVRQVIEQGESQAETSARLKVDSQYRSVRIVAKTMRSDERLRGLYHIIFELGQAMPVQTQANRETDSSLAELERELLLTRDDLYDTVEQLESANEGLRTSNEEVTSVNEELQSVNEELESSKEELQSINEELTTVNLELQSNVEEVQAANDDVSNLLSSTEVATVFLDSELCIKRFSKSATAVLNLIDSDVGRPFRHVANDIGGADIQLLASDVLQTGRGVQRVVSGPGHRDFMLRISPYYTAQGATAGVTISLTDVTALQRSVRQQMLLVELGRMAAERAPLGDLFQKAAESVAVGLRVPFTKVIELMPEGDRFLLRAGVGWKDGQVGRTYEPSGAGTQGGYTIETEGIVVVADIAQETRFVFPSLLVEHGVRSGMTVQIAGFHGRPFGVLGAFVDTPRRFDEASVNFLSTVAAFLGSVVATTSEIELRTATEQQLQEATQDLERRVLDRTRQLRMLNAQALRAEEHERRRIAEGLHDDVQQLLAASHYGLQSLLEEPGEVAPADLEEVAGWVEQALGATRSFVFDLSPTVLYEEGLGKALQHLAEQMRQRHDLSVSVREDASVDPIPQGVRVFLYSATRELLFNVVKHAGVEEAEVELSKDDESVRVTVRDRGKGIDPEAPRHSTGVGLSSLKERIEYFSGEVSIESSIGSGTSVTLKLPLSDGRETRRDDPGDHRR